jgi:hypothetical protein
MTDQISFPPLHDLASDEHEARKQHLLTEIARESSRRRLRLPLPDVFFFERPQSRRSVVAVAVMLAALAGAGVAIAATLGAFDGIGSVQHPQTPADVIGDPATADFLQGGTQPNPRGLQLDTTRLVGQFPDGQKVYVATTADQNGLCMIVGPPNYQVFCGDSLSNAHPATMRVYDYGNNDPTTRWMNFGLAIDGVTSVSFRKTLLTADGEATGPEVTVPVTDNFWTYASNTTEPPDILQPVTAHFADGTTVTEPATGPNCAAC